jgi:hypothetical protein
MLAIVGTPKGPMQSLLRHSALEITRKIYLLNAIPKEQGRAVESVEGLKFEAKFGLQHRCLRNDLVKVRVAGRPNCPQILGVGPCDSPNLSGTASARWGLEESCEYRAELTPSMPTQVSAAERL